MRFLFLFLMSFFLFACPNVDQTPQPSQILVNQPPPPTTQPDDGTLIDKYGNPYTVEEHTETSPRDRGRRSCRNNVDNRSDLRVDRLEYIDAHNFSAYELKGRCVSGERVNITINDYPIDQIIYCKSRKWELTVDLTPLTQEESIFFKISSLDESYCEDVKVTFTGPKSYVAIPALDDFYETGFLVMKYEAKLHKAGINSRAVSEAKGRPLSSISYNDAKQLCENNGSRYSLISNKQWQNIARDIESVDENWSLGKARVIEGNILNCGIFRGATKEASRSDKDDCGASSCNKGWDYNRRTHLLSSGGRIWDICGNVGEVMKDSYREGLSFNKYAYRLTGKLKDLFGPKKNYEILEVERRDSYFFGLGSTSIDRSSNIIIRGSPGRFAGVFSTEVESSREGRRSASGYNVGFRCVYLP